MAQTIVIKCEGSALKPLDELIEFQGELKSLSKENYEKLKAQILELGFCEPISVWPSPRGLLIGNGHQRLRTLSVMQHEGYQIPLIPVSFIHPQDEEEFARIVLSLCSQYGEVETQGLYEYCSLNHIPLSFVETHLRLPELELPRYKAEYVEEPASTTKQEPCPHCQRPMKQKSAK